MGFTSCPPKPRIGCTRGMISLLGYLSFFKKSQVMMSTKLLVSIRIRHTIALATFNSTTNGSLCAEVKCGLSPPLNTIIAIVALVPCSAMRTCWAPQS